MTRRGWALAAGVFAACAGVAAGKERKPQPTTTLSLGLGGYWDDNALFAAAGEETDNWTSSLRFGFGHAHPLQRRFGFGIQGQGTYYRSNLSDLSRLDYSGGAGIHWAPSNSFNLRLSQSAGSTLARDNPDLLAAGIVYGQNRVVRSASTLALGGRISRKASWSATGAYSFNLFDTGLVDDRLVTAQTQLSRLVGRYSTVFLAFGGRQSFIRSGSSRYAGLRRVYSGSAGWSRQDRRGLAITLGAGAAFREGTSDAAAIGMASISKQVKRLGASVQYSRNIENAYGIGRDRLVNNVTGSLSVTVWKATASAGFYWTFGRVFGEDFEQRSLTPTGGLSFPIALGKDLSLSVGYAYQRSNLIGGNRRGSNRFEAGLNWNHTLGAPPRR